MHVDEAVHGVVLGRMLETGSYRYNPTDCHGPTLYYLAWPVLAAMGVHGLTDLEAWHLRMISAVVGAATLLSPVSAPFVYYQRYFIHEGLFILLSLLAVLFAWRFVHDVSRRNAVGLGLATGLLFATKETAPLVIMALLLAGIATRLSQSRKTKAPWDWDRKRLAGGLLLAAAVFFATFILFYSSFGANGRGLIDAASSVLRFTHRAGGEGHAKPGWTYLAWIFAPGFYAVPWSGWMIGLLGLAGVCARWGDPLVRLLNFYTLATLLLYSAIPYKTPWLELNILAPACLLAGVGAAAVYSRMNGRLGAVFHLAGALALFALAGETGRLCFENPADARNPLAYSPTVYDIENLVRTVKAISPKHDACIQVVSDDYWPLPWYLRRDYHLVRPIAGHPGASRAGLDRALFRAAAGSRRRRSLAGGKTMSPPSLPLHRFRQEHMTTTFEIQIAHENATYARQASLAAFQTTARLERLLTRYRDDSEISQLRSLAPGETLRLSVDTFSCLRLASEMQQMTRIPASGRKWIARGAKLKCSRRKGTAPVAN